MQTFEGVVSKSAKSQYGYYFFLQNVEGIFTLGKWRAPEQGAHIKFEAEPKDSGKGYSAKGSTIVLLDSTPQPVQPPRDQRVDLGKKRRASKRLPSDGHGFDPGEYGAESDEAIDR